MNRIWIRRMGIAGLLVVFGVLLSFGVIVFWIKGYPNADDPKNIDYVLWTHGMNKNMNLDAAIAAMVHDVYPERLVKGLTKEQLKLRFGYIRPFKEASPYLQGSYHGPVTLSGHANAVVFLRNTPWMVIMDNEKAAQLILCKGY